MIKPTWQFYNSDSSNDIPDPIKKIYKAVLKDGHILICEKLNWAFPAAYKIGIYDNIMLKFMKLNGDIVGTYVDPTDYEIASWIFHSGKITLCPLQKDKLKKDGKS